MSCPLATTEPVACSICDTIIVAETRRPWIILASGADHLDDDLDVPTATTVRPRLTLSV